VIELKNSRTEARALTRKAHQTLKQFGEKGAALRELANYLLERDY
jgi:geranylgeranyl pyrophosphate synthase